MRIIGVLFALSLLAATPANAMRPALGAAPVTDRGSWSEALTEANASDAQTMLAPDPAYPFGISKISGPTLFVENGVELIAYHYVANTPTTMTTMGGDCHAAVTVRICADRLVRVSGWDAWQKTPDGYIILDGLPAGLQEFAIVSRNGGTLAGETAWTMNVDTGRTLSGVVAGIACGRGTNAVALTQLRAQPVGIFGWLAGLY